MLELMLVVAIVAIVASLAVPNIQNTVRHFRAVANAREVLSAVTAGRGQSQKTNAPVEVTIGANTVTIGDAEFTGTAESIRKTVTGYAARRTITLPGDTRFVRVERTADDGTVSTAAAGTAGSFVRFCSSSDNYYRDGAGEPVCGVGNIASGNYKVIFTTSGETWHVKVTAPLGNVDLKAGT